MSQPLNSCNSKFSSVDIVYGGFNGQQGSFKAGVKLVLHGDEKKIKELQVDCVEVEKRHCRYVERCASGSTQ
jgi:hypothetical protein